MLQILNVRHPTRPLRPISCLHPFLPGLQLLNRRKGRSHLTRTAAFPRTQVPGSVQVRETPPAKRIGTTATKTTNQGITPAHRLRLSCSPGLLDVAALQESPVPQSSLRKVSMCRSLHFIVRAKQNRSSVNRAAVLLIQTSHSMRRQSRSKIGGAR